MDIPRPKKPRNRLPLVAAIAAGVVLATVGLTRMKPAAPGVERSTLLIDRVQRGEMVREVRGNGTLVPEDLRIVSAMTAGRIERIVARPGTKVESGSVLLELSNPDVQLEALDAERQLKLAEAELATQRATLETQRLGAVGAVASARTSCARPSARSR